jgi:hypothetical protein
LCVDRDSCRDGGEGNIITIIIDIDIDIISAADLAGDAIDAIDGRHLW